MRVVFLLRPLHPRLIEDMLVRRTGLGVAVVEQRLTQLEEAPLL